MDYPSQKGLVGSRPHVGSHCILGDLTSEAATMLNCRTVMDAPPYSGVLDFLLDLRETVPLSRDAKRWIDKARGQFVTLKDALEDGHCRAGPEAVRGWIFLVRRRDEQGLPSWIGRCR